MDTQKREFTGVWIPRHVIEDKDLTMTEKIVYAEIACFNICTKSNESLGERYGLSSKTISTAISSLVSRGYVENLGVVEGRYRRLVAHKDPPQLPGSLAKNGYPPTPKTSTIDNNIDNIRECTTNVVHDETSTLPVEVVDSDDIPEHFPQSMTAPLPFSPRSETPPSPKPRQVQYGNARVNFVLAQYKEQYGVSPIDRHARNIAQAFVKNVEAFLKVLPDRNFEDTVRKVFSNYGSELGEEIRPQLDTVRRRGKQMMEAAIQKHTQKQVRSTLQTIRSSYETNT